MTLQLTGSDLCQLTQRDCSKAFVVKQTPRGADHDAMAIAHINHTNMSAQNHASNLISKEYQTTHDAIE